MNENPYQPGAGEPNRPRRWQFSMEIVMIATAAMCLSLALMRLSEAGAMLGTFGFIGSIAFFIAPGAIPERFAWAVLAMVLALFVLPLLAHLLVMNTLR